MSKLYKKYLELKKINLSTIYIFKSGIFYLFIDEDAKKISPLLNLKLNNLNENILKYGFPVNSLQKYINILKNANINFKIIEDLSIESNFNLQKNTIDINTKFNIIDFKNFLEKIAIINIDNLSIREIYSFLEKLSEEAKLFLNKL